MIKNCPRCGRSFPDWQPVHLACALQRMRLWLLALAVFVFMLLAAALLASHL